MNIHYLQHVPFEGLGSMESRLIVGDHQFSSVLPQLETENSSC